MALDGGCACTIVSGCAVQRLATGCAVLRERVELQRLVTATKGGRGAVKLLLGMLLRTCYAMSGTDICYGATRQADVARGAQDSCVTHGIKESHVLKYSGVQCRGKRCGLTRTRESRLRMVWCVRCVREQRGREKESARAKEREMMTKAVEGGRTRVDECGRGHDE
eukprot:2028856-Rhodomonas_salina.2